MDTFLNRFRLRRSEGTSYDARAVQRGKSADRKPVSVSKRWSLQPEDELVSRQKPQQLSTSNYESFDTSQITRRACDSNERPTERFRHAVYGNAVIDHQGYSIGRSDHVDEYEIATNDYATASTYRPLGAVDGDDERTRRRQRAGQQNGDDQEYVTECKDDVLGEGSILEVKATPREDFFLLDEDGFDEFDGDGVVVFGDHQPLDGEASPFYGSYCSAEENGEADRVVDEQRQWPWWEGVVATPASLRRSSLSDAAEGDLHFAIMSEEGDGECWQLDQLHKDKCTCGELIGKALDERDSALAEKALAERKLVLMTARRDHYARRFYRVAQQCKQMASNVNSLTKDVDHAHEQQRILANALRLVTDRSSTPPTRHTIISSTARGSRLETPARKSAGNAASSSSPEVAGTNAVPTSSSSHSQKSHSPKPSSEAVDDNSFPESQTPLANGDSPRAAEDNASALPSSAELEKSTKRALCRSGGVHAKWDSASTSADCSPSHRLPGYGHASTLRSHSLQSTSGYTTGYASCSDNADSSSSVPTSPEPLTSTAIANTSTLTAGSQCGTNESDINSTKSSQRNEENLSPSDTQNGQTGCSRTSSRYDKADLKCRQHRGSLSSLLRDGKAFRHRGDDDEGEHLVASSPGFSGVHCKPKRELSTSISTLPFVKQMQLRRGSATDPSPDHHGNLSRQFLSASVSHSLSTTVSASHTKSQHGLSYRSNISASMSGGFEELRVISQSLANLKQIRQSVVDLTALVQDTGNGDSVMGSQPQLSQVLEMCRVFEEQLHSALHDISHGTLGDSMTSINSYSAADVTTATTTTTHVGGYGGRVLPSEFDSSGLGDRRLSLPSLVAVGRKGHATSRGSFGGVRGASSTLLTRAGSIVGGCLLEENETHSADASLSPARRRTSAQQPSPSKHQRRASSSSNDDLLGESTNGSSNVDSIQVSSIISTLNKLTPISEATLQRLSRRRPIRRHVSEGTATTDDCSPGTSKRRSPNVNDASTTPTANGLAGSDVASANSKTPVRNQDAGDDDGVYRPSPIAADCNLDEHHNDELLDDAIIYHDHRRCSSDDSCLRFSPSSELDMSLDPTSSEMNLCRHNYDDSNANDDNKEKHFRQSKKVYDGSPAIISGGGVQLVADGDRTPRTIACPLTASSLTSSSDDCLDAARGRSPECSDASSLCHSGVGSCQSESQCSCRLRQPFAVAGLEVKTPERVARVTEHLGCGMLSSIPRSVTTTGLSGVLDHVQEELSKDDVHRLCKELTSPQTVMKTLKFGGGQLDYEDILLLTSSIRRNSTLTSLSLHDCTIGCMGAELLGSAIRHTGNITSISLHNNLLGDLGLQALSMSLKYSIGVQRLSLGYQKLSDSVVTSIIEIVCNCKNLRLLSVDGSQFSLLSVDHLETAAKCYNIRLSLEQGAECDESILSRPRQQVGYVSVDSTPSAMMVQTIMTDKPTLRTRPRRQPVQKSSSSSMSRSGELKDDGLQSCSPSPQQPATPVHRGSIVRRLFHRSSDSIPMSRTPPPPRTTPPLAEFSTPLVEKPIRTQSSMNLFRRKDRHSGAGGKSATLPSIPSSSSTSSAPVAGDSPAMVATVTAVARNQQGCLPRQAEATRPKPYTRRRIEAKSQDHLPAMTRGHKRRSSFF